MMERRLVLSAMTMAFAALGVGCADTPTAVETPDAVDMDFEPQLDIVQGDDQSGVVGQELAKPIIVRLTNPQGAPMPGVLVNFIVTTRTNLSGQGAAGSVWSGSAVTNEDGIAWDWWTLGYKTSEAQTLEVRFVNQRGVRRLGGTFTATAVAGAPTSIFATDSMRGYLAGSASLGAGGYTTTPELTDVMEGNAQPYRYVYLTDRWSNPVTNHPVLLTAAVGSAPDTIFTDERGLAPVVDWITGATPVDEVQSVVARAAGFDNITGSARDSVYFLTRVYPVPADASVEVRSVGGDTAWTSPDTINVGSAATTVRQICLGLVDGSGAPVTGTHHLWLAATGADAQGRTNFATSQFDATGCAVLYLYTPVVDGARVSGSNELRFTIPGIQGEAVADFELVVP